MRTGSGRVFHQAKRRHPNSKWRLPALRAHGVPRTIGAQLTGNHDRVVFASGDDAPELSELCEAANEAESYQEFERVCLAAESRRVRFEELRGWWTCEGLRLAHHSSIDTG